MTNETETVERVAAPEVLDGVPGITTDYVDPDPTEPVVEARERVRPEADEGKVRLRVDPFGCTRDKVAIVGFTDHRKLAFELGDDFELWGLNELYRYEPVEKFHRWFEIHARSDFEKDDEGRQHLKDLAKLDIPVYMHTHFDDIPPSLPFPKADLERYFDSTYFTSSPAWMVAMAIAFGFKEIHVYGVDLAQDGEYFGQRPCMEYWLGRAAGAGIKVYRPETSDLLSSVGQYGFGAGGAFAAKVQERLKYLHTRDNAILNALREMEAKKADIDAKYEQQKQALVSERNQMVGAIQDCNFWQRSWAVPQDSKANSAVPDRSQDPRTGIAKVA